ncbi:uncharacterized protein PHALS_14759 [Plasmopara halstedii]|uniref:Uncharacterized protein n=1 Tax=Plasmopara halstedii TaxID=4781 RepID=A0A0P1AUQ2_PLAHL|nr:uncharacterized protein PHALS_14759 [Plasmopara halstedii]CEG45118.1 hypothetical protein PHALS_14759 [Plasmopara halstedii]|eukprot:XP_024581487.1 hypothetical protein PHALS_14759 [Plasmopara halstedii]
MNILMKTITVKLTSSCDQIVAHSLTSSARDAFLLCRSVELSSSHAFSRDMYRALAIGRDILKPIVLTFSFWIRND